MTRIKSAVTQRKRHKKILTSNKGFRGTKSRLYKVAHEAFIHAGQYAYEGRKKRKRDMRRGWILSISEAVKPLGISYSKFIHNLKKANIDLDRKSLSNLVVNDPAAFKTIVDKVTKSS